MSTFSLSRAALLGAAAAGVVASAMSLSSVALASPPVQAEKPITAPAPKSPFVTDADLFAHLNYALPALAPVKAAVDTGDMAGAKRAFAAYLRARTSVPWNTPVVVADRSAIKWDKKKADDAAAGRVVVVTVPHTFPNGDIDWHFDATGRKTGLPANNEWVWQLNRMGWWGDLANAYQATGDEKWAFAWVKQFRSWVVQNPPVHDRAAQAGSAWRGIESGLRMSFYWPKEYHTFLRSPAFTDEDLITYVRVSMEHARHIAAFPSGGNHLTMEMSGLYSVGALFPELTEAEGWRKQAADTMSKEIAVQFLPDGAQYELSPGYHDVARGNFLKIASVAKMTGHESELPPDFLKRTEGAFAYDLLLMTPNRSLPRFNDSWDANVPNRLSEGVRLFPDRKDFLWGKTNGKEGTPPRETSHAFPWAGFFVMRSDWSTTANYAVLDAGPLGNGHEHQDKLNFVVWAWGREMLFDSGGGSYEKSKYRAYATDTFGHNTVLVDNLPQRRNNRDIKDRVSSSPIDAKWQSTPEYDFAEGVYDEGYGKIDNKIATHTRRVLFVKNPGFWIVSDILTPNDTKPHTYQARWNLLTEAAYSDQRDTDPEEILTTDANLPNLAIVSLPVLSGPPVVVRMASAQTEPELLGWNVRKDLDPQYVPALTVLHTKKNVTGQQRFLTLLTPLKPGQANISNTRKGTNGSDALFAMPGVDGLVTVTEHGVSGSLEVSFTQNGQTRRIVGGLKGK